MFHATQRLTHLLHPTAYSSDEQYAWEMKSVFKSAWHFVALQTELAHSGDFITTELCGLPIQVRNISETICAVSNVCAHRHCLLTSKAKGSSPKLKCQYHGWEYNSSGYSQKIPGAQHFGPLDRDAAKIPVYRAETLGPLVFVNLDAAAPCLADSLGDSFDAIRRGFGSDWRIVKSKVFTQAVNWKIPIENSLEAYHVPSIHPGTFREDPGESRSEHLLSELGSSFHTTLPFAPHSKMDAFFQRVEGRVFRALSSTQPTGTYQQHQVFPNLLFSFTDMLSLLHVVRPTGPQSCLSIVHQFGRTGTTSTAKLGGKLWGKLSSTVLFKIMEEDFELYPDIQRGLNSSHSPGMLGRCEERIHHFQSWLQNQLTDQATPPDMRTECSSVRSHDDSQDKACDSCTAFSPPNHI